MSDTLDPAPDPILAAINAETEFVEATRKYPTKRCRLFRSHLWGIALEDYRKDTTISRQVCTRGRMTWRGRCPAEQPVSVPDESPMVEEKPPPVFLLPVSEILRLHRWDWGHALPGPYPTGEGKRDA